MHNDKHRYVIKWKCNGFLLLIYVSNVYYSFKSLIYITNLNNNALFYLVTFVPSAVWTILLGVIVITYTSLVSCEYIMFIMYSSLVCLIICCYYYKFKLVN